MIAAINLTGLVIGLSGVVVLALSILMVKRVLNRRDNKVGGIGSTSNELKKKQ